MFCEDCEQLHRERLQDNDKKPVEWFACCGVLGCFTFHPDNFVWPEICLPKYTMTITVRDDKNKIVKKLTRSTTPIDRKNKINITQKDIDE